MKEKLNNLAKETNEFIENTLKYFRLKEGETLLSFNCTRFFNPLCEKLFICRFLYDSVKKGINYHKNWIKNNRDSIAKKISDRHIPKIVSDFEAIIENKDLIIILAYDFFLNYLAEVVIDILRNNQNFLMDIKSIEFRGHEIINRLREDPNLIIEDLISIFLYGKKEEGNLRTNPEFWIDVLKNIKISLTKEEISFWKSFHIRRNAYSHLFVKQQWKDYSKNLSNIDFILWLYGLLYLSYQIENKICLTYNYKKSEFSFDFSGQSFYDFEKFLIS